MKTRTSFLSFLLFLFPSLLIAQHRIGAALRAGPGYYVGDLKRNSLPEAAYLKPVVGASVHYRYRYFLDVSYRFSFGQLVGGDQMGNVQPSRNLDFETLYYTNELRVNYYPIIVFADGVAKKKASTVACAFGKNTPREVFKPSVGIGVGHFHFNPYSRSGGSSVYLKPLGTEGQNIPGYRKPYKLDQPALFYDIGFVVNPLRNLELEVNVEYVQLFTDYLDDVSTTYPDVAALQNYSGSQGVAYSYKGAGSFPQEGFARGNPLKKDGSFRGFITLRYMFALNITPARAKLPNELNRKTKKQKKVRFPREQAPQ
ncbi:MAG: hypothetical protein MH137_07805 [Flavobacteriales bacterium]|nr:hypothetical protein [Flavobacteriales bacterium]